MHHIPPPVLRGPPERGDEEEWCAFLDSYAPVLLQVARAVEQDEDAAADAFVYVCERLAENRCARLRRFDPDGPAQFVTWLRAVARNLSIDHRRRRLGRPRLFEAVMRLPALHHHVFRLRYRYKLTLDQTFESLRPRFPGLTLAAVAAADTRIGATLSGRQTRALVHVQPRFEPLDTTDSGVPEGFTPVEACPNPEDVALVREQRSQLRSAIADLAPDDRLMVALRFEEGLTLAAVARVAGLRDAQHADRRLRQILERLRSALG